MNNTVQKLRTCNLKVTSQRIAVYDTVSESKEHPSAEMVYNSLRPTHPTISLATVYKTLATFAQAGLISELPVSGVLRYDIIEDNHCHFVCNDCQHIIDIEPLDSMQQVRAELTQTTNFEATCDQLFFFGLCDKCRG